MNKISLWGTLYPQKLRTNRIFIIMRITLFLAFVSAFSLFAGNTHSQNARITLSKSNSTLEVILNEIENQTDYLFIINSNVNTQQKTSVKAKEEPVSKVLDELFKETDVHYTMEGTHIVLSNKTVAKVSAAQQARTITGKIIDETGEPLIGVSVLVKGTNNGSITNVNGDYTIAGDINSKTILVITYIGMKKQEVEVGNRNRINVTMTTDSEALDEVVVIGYGTSKKSDLTGSVASVNVDKLNTASNLNLGQALQGKMAGVEVVSTGGQPGAGSRILIRGLGTLNNSNPLYIIDGMYMDNMDFLNPNDVKSISVLKDASAAAIYGSRAANGVIIIETKSGTNTEGKPTVKLSADIGVQVRSKKIDMLNAKEWAELSTLARANSNLKPFQMAQDVDKLADNDWQAIMMRPALQQNYNVSITGGGNHFTYYTSMGYKKQEGIIRGTDYDRFNATIKATYHRAWFSAGTNLLFSMDTYTPAWGGGFSRGGSVGAILETLPCLPKYDENNLGGYAGPYGDVSNAPNPLASTDKNIYWKENKGYNTYLNIYAQAELPLGIKYKLSATPNFSFNNGMEFINVYDMGIVRSTERNLMRDNTFRYNFLIENTLSYDKIFNDVHKVSAVVGYTYQKAERRYSKLSGKNMPEGIYEIDGTTASSRGAVGNFVENSLTSILARVFYSYKDRYFITATFRRDGSSRFAKENHYGNYPSISAGYNIAKEEFMSFASGWLDELKLRGGYGVLGNQEIGDYTYASVVTPGINYPDGEGGVEEGAYPTDFANPVIRWEKTSMTNIGLDFAGFRNRLTATVEWYNKITDDILINVPIPPSTGAGNDPTRNAGKISNKGFEFIVGWRDNINKDWAYNVSFNGSIVKNNVEKMGTGDQVLWGSGGCKTLEGYPVAGFWLVQTDGLFQSKEEVDGYTYKGQKIQPLAQPGDQKYMDANNDGKIDDNDRVYMGSSFPKFAFGVDLGFSYKGLDFRVDLQGNYGAKLFNQTFNSFDMPGGGNGLAIAKDYWSETNRDASHPRLQADDPNHNYWGSSSRYLEDASYLRIRNIQIGYNFPTNWFKNQIKNIRVYANVENLVTFTKYSGYTPDISGYDVLNRGFDRFAYPSSRVFMCGVNLSF